MKSSKMLAIVVLALGLIVWSAPIVYGAQSLTVNGQPLDSITLEVGQLCTVEVVSDDSRSYEDYVGFDNGIVLGDFSHRETTRNAGDDARVTEYDESAFYGYYVRADGGLLGGPRPGVHFIFQYEAQQVGETDVKLYDRTRTSVIDSVHITIVPAPMGTVFTYQGSLNDTGSPADGLYDFEFELYDSIIGGNQEGNTIDLDNVDVIEGQFVMELDFGSDPNIFNGYARWLQVGVRPGDSNEVYTMLSPRIELMPTPYAVYARTAGYTETAGYAQSAPPGHSLDAADGTPTDSVYVDDNGNVGIGTTQPDCQLHVNLGYGYVKCGGPSQGDILGGHFDGGGDGAAVRATLGGPPSSTAAYLAYSGASGIFAGYFQGNTRVTTDLTVDGRYYDSSRSAGISGQFLGSTGTGTSWAEVDWSNLANVPSGFADGIDDVGSGDTDWTESGGNVYRQTGNVGIRTSQPDCPLHVNLPYGYVKCGGPLEGDILEGHFNGGGEGAAVRATLGGPPSSTAAYLAYSDGASYLAGYFEGDVYASGNVGIGTASPQCKLDVGGSVAVSYNMMIQGNVVIGEPTIASDAQVEIVGPFRGKGLYAKAAGLGSFGVVGETEGVGAGVKGIASYSGDLPTFGGYFEAFEGRNGVGVYAKGGQDGYAAEFIGNVRIGSHSTGLTVMELGEGLDYAEGFDVCESTKIDAGSVLIIDAENPGKLAISDKPYDSKVAGIVAGANGQGSGVRLGAGQFDYDVALAGRVYCNVDATEAGVEPGDLLTTSATPGYAMKSTDYARAQGAILGKAMESLQKGQKGQILVLVTLQ